MLRTVNRIRNLPREREIAEVFARHGLGFVLRRYALGRWVLRFRGTPPADADAIVDLLLRLARLADDLPEIAELDLNPVLALPDRCVAVDARVRVARRATPRRAKSW